MSTPRTKKIWKWALAVSVIVAILVAAEVATQPARDEQAKKDREDAKLEQALRTDFKAKTERKYPWLQVSDLSGITKWNVGTDITVHIGKCTYKMQADSNITTETVDVSQAKWHIVPYTQEPAEDLWSDLQLKNGAPPYGDVDCPSDPLKKPSPG